MQDYLHERFWDPSLAEHTVTAHMCHQEAGIDLADHQFGLIPPNRCSVASAIPPNRCSIASAIPPPAGVQ